MKKFICIFIVLCLLITITNVKTVHAKELPSDDLYSIGAVLIDGESGRILLSKNADQVRPMASTTKIMTLIIALEYGKLDYIANISKYATSMPKVKLGFSEGDQFYLEDLLYSLILESHNDTAVAVAECVSGSVEEFARLMNNKARELGLANTYFITPNGLDASDDTNIHSTTAYDLSLIMKYCVCESPMKDKFIEICQTRSYSFSDIDKKRTYTVYNANAFLDQMEGVIAGKTGFTADAGYCYVCALKRDEKIYILALLGCGWPYNKNYKWKDSKKLFNYAIDNYHKENILNSSSYKQKVNIVDGIEVDYIDTYICEDINAVISEEDKIKYNIKVPKTVAAPVKKDDTIGCIEIYINDDLYKTVNVYAKESVNKINLIYYINRLSQKIIF